MVCDDAFRVGVGWMIIAYTLLLYTYVGSYEREEERMCSYHTKVVWIEETSYGT